MTQDELWNKNYEAVLALIKENKRNLSKYNLEERRLFTWLKHNRKILNADGMAEPRLSLFRELMEVGEKYKRKNQYQ